MSGINKVFLLGTLDRDAEMRYDHNGRAVAQLQLSTVDTWQESPAQASYQTTEQHNVVLLGMLAEELLPKLVEGASVCVEGMIRTRKAGSANGFNGSASDIVARKPGAAQIIEDDAEPDAPRRKPPTLKPREKTEELEDVPF